MVDELVSACGPGPWTLARVLGHGWTIAQVRGAVDGGRLSRPFRGVLDLPRGGPQPSEGSPRATASRIAAIRAALLVAGGRAVVSHCSAALVRGIWTPDGPSALVHLTLPGVPDRLDHGMVLHGSRLPAELLTRVDGMEVTTIARTAVDLARGRRLPAALVAVDGAARRIMSIEHGVSPLLLRDPEHRRRIAALAAAEFANAYESVRTWPGTVVVRQALTLIEPASESPFESRSRGWMLEGGLPRPAVAHAVRGASGRSYFADFAWTEHRVLGEADGTAKYGGDRAEVTRSLRRERQRQRDLEDAGWTVVRWDSGEHPRQVVARLARALAARPH